MDAVEQALERVYRTLFAPQDRAIRAFSSWRFDRALREIVDTAETHAAALAYHDRLTVLVLANLGLSTQLVVLGACLVAGVPTIYLWLVVAMLPLLVALQLRREWLVRRRAA